MPANNFKRVNLDLIYPAFLEKVLEAIAACNALGATYIATHGFRSYGEQMALWTQGRTTGGPIVTNAKGGQSAHNFGLAMDFVRDMGPQSGVQPSWDKVSYEILGQEAAKQGLHWGAAYKDYPHVGLEGYINGAQIKPLDLIYRASQGTELEKLRNVWKYVDAHA